MRYSETKRKRVLAYFENGGTHVETAKKFKISTGTLYSWAKQANQLKRASKTPVTDPQRYNAVNSTYAAHHESTTPDSRDVTAAHASWVATTSAMNNKIVAMRQFIIKQALAKIGAEFVLD